MRVFVTGATGFIGSAVVKELLSAGHEVLGLSRSREKAEALTTAGAEVLYGSVNDPDVLRQGVGRTDGVIHLAFNHDFSTFVANCEDDRRIIELLGSTLRGSSRPLIITSGVAIASTVPGQPALEDNPTIDSSVSPRAASEEAGIAAAARGANVSVVRLPQVHDTSHAGLINYVISIAREKKMAAYIGDGSARWPAAHVLDVARLYRLAVERAENGAKYHAVADEGVSMKQIAEVIGRRFGIPAVSIPKEEAAAYFGWLAAWTTHDMWGSSARTRKKLGWQPQERGLIADLEQWSDPAS